MDDYDFLFEKMINHSHLFFDFKGGLDMQKSEKVITGRKRVGIMDDVNLRIKNIKNSIKNIVF